MGLLASIVLAACASPQGGSGEYRDASSTEADGGEDRDASLEDGGGQRTDGSPPVRPLAPRHPFGIFSSTGYRPEHLQVETIASRPILQGFRMETTAGRRAVFLALDGTIDDDNARADDRSRHIITLTSEFNSNRWSGPDEDPQKSFCAPLGQDLVKARTYVRLVVERYDGDEDFGCSLGGETDCYEAGDGLYPSAAARASIAASPVKTWQIENEIFDQLLDCPYDEETGGYTHPADKTQARASAETIVAHVTALGSEVKLADPTARVVFPSLTGLEVPLFLDGRIDRFATGVDCNYRSIDRATYERWVASGTPLPDELLNRQAMIEEILTRTQDIYDIIDFHDYSDDPYFSEAVVAWFRRLLGDSKPIISTENAGPWHFFPFLEGVEQPACPGADPCGCPAAIACLTERCDFQPYDHAIHAEHVVKRYVVAIAAGLDTLFWATLVEQVLPFHDSFKRLGLVRDLDGSFEDRMGHEEKPAFLTYALLVEKIDGFTEVEELEEDIYRFRFEGRPDLLVAWSQTGDRVTDLSAYLGTGELLVTHLVTEPGQRQPAIEVVPSTAVALGTRPIFLEPKDAPPR